MTTIEALEALRNGISVVAFEKDARTGKELFMYVSPNTIELHLPDESDHPADVMSEIRFLETYPRADFVAYNIKIK